MERYWCRKDHSLPDKPRGHAAGFSFPKANSMPVHFSEQPCSRVSALPALLHKRCNNRPFNNLKYIKNFQSVLLNHSHWHGPCYQAACSCERKGASMVQIGHRISPYFRFILGKPGQDGLIYHALRGNGCLASEKLIWELAHLAQDSDRLQCGDHRVPLDLIDTLIQKGFIETTPVPAKKSPSGTDPTASIHYMKLCVAESCNMRCSYCYVNCHTDATLMNRPVAQRAIHLFCDILDQHKHTGSISYFGGEPLLNWPCIVDTIPIIEERIARTSCITSIRIATNGTLIDRDKAIFLKEHNIHVAVSLDGNRTQNDSTRTMRNGSGSFDQIIRALDHLQGAKVDKLCLICTVGDHNCDELQAIIDIAAERSLRLTFQNAYAEIRDKSLHIPTKAIIDRFLQAVDYANTRNVHVGGSWQWPFQRLFRQPNTPSNCAACGRELCVSTDGSLKPCPGFDEHYGTIFDIDAALRSGTFQRLARRSAPDIPGCAGCDIEGLCAGGCALNAYKNNGTIMSKSDGCQIARGMFRALTQRYLHAIQNDEGLHHINGLPHNDVKGECDENIDRKKYSTITTNKTGAGQISTNIAPNG